MYLYHIGAVDYLPNLSICATWYIAGRTLGEEDKKAK